MRAPPSRAPDQDADFDEDVPMIERRYELDVLAQQHPIAEDITAHVTDADTAEVGGLGSRSISRKCRRTRLPGASSSDAHGLVVVAARAAGGKRVA